MNTRSTSPGHVPELDGLRGLLALWVLLTHLLCLTGYVNASASHCWTCFIFGYPAVECFMVLSGFAIAALLGKRQMGYLAFMHGRAFRILPVYLVCLGLAWGTMHLIPSLLSGASWRGTVYFGWTRDLSLSELGHPWTHLLAHLTLLHGLLPASVLPNATGTILPPAWSISLEWQFYLIAPVLVWLLRSWTGWIVALVVCLFGVHLGPQWQNPHLAFLLGGQLPLFLLGIGSYHLWRLCWGDWMGVSLLVSISAMAALCAGLLHWHAVAVTIWALCFASAVTMHPLNPLRLLLLNRAVQAVGRGSYSLYLIHWPIIVATLALLLHVWPAITSAQALGVMVLVGLPTIGLATAILHRYVEVPMMALGKARADGMQVTPAQGLAKMV